MNFSQNYFTIDPSCFTKYPNFKAGILIVKNINNVASHSTIGDKKLELESQIRQKFSGFTRDQLNELPIIKAYNDYYKNFQKTYHVRAQVESIINGKSLPNVSALLESMFMAELKNMLLTAGHDVDTLKFPVRLIVANGDESYIAINNSEKKAYQDDLMMVDEEGIISTILTGPDSRTKITPNTKNALFAVYAPAEIDPVSVKKHLEDIEDYLLLFSPELKVSLLEVFEV